MDAKPAAQVNKIYGRKKGLDSWTSPTSNVE